MTTIRQLMQLGFSRFFAPYYAEWITVPFAIVAVGYILFGKAYFDDWGVLIRSTLVCVVIAMMAVWANHQVRDWNLRRFQRLDEWYWRLLYSLPGYWVVNMSGASLAVVVFEFMSGGRLVVSSGQWFGLFLLSTVMMLAGAAAHEALIYWRKWRAALIEAEQLEKLHLETQFQSLQDQLNPHFLFNSLNVLSSLITENPRRAEDFVDQLSKVYRYLLRSNDRGLVRVGEETGFIRSFFHLLATRYETGISLDIQVPPAWQERLVPALALQILLENAVKHNEIAPEKPLHIELFVQENEGQASLVMRNNVQPKSTPVHSSRVGLENLRLRYELLGETGFIVHNDGRFFTVELPLLESSATILS